MTPPPLRIITGQRSKPVDALLAEIDHRREQRHRDNLTRFVIVLVSLAFTVGVLIGRYLR